MLEAFNPLQSEHPIKLVMFDLDGTLVDSVPDLHAAVCAMLETMEREAATIEQVKSWVGNGAQVLVKRALSNNITIDPELSEESFNKAFKAFLSHYTNTNGNCAQLYPGVKELISKLKALGIHIAIVTNKPEQFTLPLLDTLEISADLVLSGDSLPTKKPDPAPLLKCLKDFDCNPVNALMIGDSISDIKASRAADVPVIAVSYGYNHGMPIRDMDADRIVDSLEELS